MTKYRCIVCDQTKCDCPKSASCNPAIILETGLAAVRDLLPHQTALVELDGFFNGMKGPAGFLPSRPRWGYDETWKMMDSALGEQHERGLERACASRDGWSWYRVGDLIVKIQRLCIGDDDKGAAFGQGAFTVSVFDPGVGA